jgi:hypothetical protein
MKSAKLIDNGDKNATVQGIIINVDYNSNDNKIRE